MKTPSLFPALVLAFAGAAHAQSPSDAPRTRAQVRAETAAAVRSGDIPSGYDGLAMKDLLPAMYAHDAARRARTAATASAQRVAASGTRKSGN